jgi:hypothetical protein
LVEKVALTKSSNICKNYTVVASEGDGQDEQKDSLVKIIPTLVWAVGFALEQSLHVVTFACPASGNLKQLEYNVWNLYRIRYGR